MVWQFEIALQHYVMRWSY